MYCPYCGHKIENEKAKFCPKCGHELPRKQTDNSSLTPQMENAVPTVPQAQAAPSKQKKRRGWFFLLLVIVLAVAAGAAVLFWLSPGAKDTTVSTTEKTSQLQDQGDFVSGESQARNIPQAINTPSPIPVATPTPTPVPTPVPTPIVTQTPVATELPQQSEYILPHSDTEQITLDQLQGLSSTEARIARNEILARHGRKFKDQELQAHFDGCSWYTGTVEADDFDYMVLSPLEQQNVEVIKEYEASLSQ